MLNMSKDARDKERRAQKIAEKQNLEKRKVLRDRHYHVIEDDDEEDEDRVVSRYGYLLKGQK